MALDDNASTIAKRKKLEQSLADAKADLAESEYENQIKLSQEALDKQYENYEKERNDEIEKLKESLNDRDAILSESFQTVKENADIIGQEIASIAVNHGITISDALISSWKSGEDAIAGYGDALSQGTSAFIGNIMGVENEMWNLQANANNTASTLAWMFSTRADNLVGELTKSYYAEGNLANMTDTLRQALVNTLERGYDISSIVNSLDSIRNAANEAANAISKVGNSTVNTAVPENNTTSNQSYASRPKTNGNEDEEKKKFVGGGGSVPKHFAQLPASGSQVHVYASGTRNAKGQIRVINEEGQELTLPKLKSGNYAIGNDGDQILTKEQTDNMFGWSNIDPEEVFSAGSIERLWGKMVMEMPMAEKKAAPSVYIDNRLTVNGDVNELKHLQEQMQKIAEKTAVQATDRGINKFVDKMCDGIMYGRC